MDGAISYGSRDLASTAILAIPGTEGGYKPFWSPDSRSVAFFVMGPVPSSKQFRSQEDRHACWRRQKPDLIAIDGTWADGSILFGPSEGRIYRVAETGGTATRS